jgi:hypothetical protein
MYQSLEQILKEIASNHYAAHFDVMPDCVNWQIFGRDKENNVTMWSGTADTIELAKYAMLTQFMYLPSNGGHK